MYTVPVSETDKVFMSQCQSVIESIGSDSQKLYESAARELLNDNPKLSHPHAVAIAWLLEDIDEGHLIEKYEWSGNLQNLKRAVEDFNGGKIYPAHYLLSTGYYKIFKKKPIESFGLSANRDEENMFGINCAEPTIKKLIVEIAQKTPITDNPKDDLENLGRSLPDKVGDLIVSSEIYVKAHLLKSLRDSIYGS